jgi:uncharacterized membrane protein HdeD (DUF308 family)
VADADRRHRRNRCQHPTALRAAEKPLTLVSRSQPKLMLRRTDHQHSSGDRRRSIMDRALTRGSWLLALGGIAAVIFGIAALIWPGITLVALVILFGAYALVGGVFMLVGGLDLGTEHGHHWVLMVFSGLFGIAIGVFTFFRPGITALALVYLIAVWAILTGILEFAAGIELTGRVNGAWALWLGGALSVAFGVLIALRPAGGALAIVWLIGIYAIVFGFLRIVYAFRAQSDRRVFERPERDRSVAAG